MRLLFLALLLLWPVAALARHPVAIDHGVVYRLAGDRRLALDVYRPRDASDPRPAVVCIHGGSWSTGDRWDMAPFARDLAGRGFVAATIEYRLAGEAPFLAAVADARHAVRWLAAQSGRFGVDPRRIGVFGLSAGGHLALMVATLRTPVQACAAWCTATATAWSRSRRRGTWSRPPSATAWTSRSCACATPATSWPARAPTRRRSRCGRGRWRSSSAR